MSVFVITYRLLGESAYRVHRLAVVAHSLETAEEFFDRWMAGNGLESYRYRLLWSTRVNFPRLCKSRRDDILRIMPYEHREKAMSLIPKPKKKETQSCLIFENLTPEVTAMTNGGPGRNYGEPWTYGLYNIAVFYPPSTYWARDIGTGSPDWHFDIVDANNFDVFRLGALKCVDGAFEFTYVVTKVRFGIYDSGAVVHRAAPTDYTCGDEYITFNVSFRNLDDTLTRTATVRIKLRNDKCDVVCKPCCGSTPIKKLLLATFSGCTGPDCSHLRHFVILEYGRFGGTNWVSSTWVEGDTPGGVDGGFMTLDCIDLGGETYSFTTNLLFGFSPSASSCSPFSVTFTGVKPSSLWDCTCNVTITPMP